MPLSGEVKVNNNRVETLITIRKGGLRIAYFDIWRPEAKFLRRLNETAEVQLDWQVVLSGAQQSRTRIDPQLFEAGKYDAYIIGDVPAKVFGPGLLEKLAARVNEGAGLLMTGGLRNFGAGGYAETPLAALLPDEKLSHMARFALERIPAPEAAKALREALSKTQGEVKIGVISSLPDLPTRLLVFTVEGDKIIALEGITNPDRVRGMDLALIDD